MKSKLQKYFSGLGKNIFLLTFASFFSDIATEMLYPLLPIFITETLHASGSILGIIEGIAQATQYCIQGLSGYISDKLHRRKPIALIGFILSAVSRPFIGVAAIWPAALAARFSDRLGAGTRSAPRDALISSSVDAKNTGKAFGLEGIGDNLGACIGPLITIVLFFWLALGIRTIFYLTVIPGLLSVVMIFFVKEKRSAARPDSKPNIHLRQFPKTYWKYLLVTALFSIGNSSNTFLILQTKGKGCSLEMTVLLYAMSNLAAALTSMPSGSLSDKLGRKPLLLAAFIIFLISYAGFAFASSIFLIGALFIFYGLFQGIFRTVGKSFVTDFIPQHLQASGLGWYSTTVGLSQLIASIVAGFLWDGVGHSAVFIYGSAVSLIGIISLVIFIPNIHRKTTVRG
jgi:MFS family permease